ncbi:MAG: hypothetical protein GWN00_12585, partial [Aliifodinibius sp.]|nr:hypothetical protein [Phycisphaerae bacterium]NIR67022.1 hypothetical protein [candidate division Zixibacteria bacterium]NIT57029.1 hypothetical protein [Fodinibius sp.]NIW44899.1 hypothetical protein [Gammaproteobacteria bacterium]NIS48443.1 hypothetical protein [candidate division Zixibacteria bacterium]
NGGYQNNDIYGYDLLTKNEFEICTALGMQQEADISGNLVVWNNEGDIYGTYIPELAVGDLLVCMPIYDGVPWYDGSNGEYLGDFISPSYGGLDRPTGITFGPDCNLYVG